jgi:prophage tail gpP-like protein
MAGTVELPEIIVSAAPNAAPLQLNALNNVPDDVATLSVRGQLFTDWESVEIVAEHVHAASHFRFTAAERSDQFEALKQFGPGDKCAIYLGNSLTIDGYLELRQVGYDSDRHAIELMGVNVTAPVMRSSVDTKTGSFDGMNFQQVAQKVLAPYAGIVGLKIVGAINPLPFVQLQNQPGEPIYDFLERIARPRGIIVGNDSFSNVLAIGVHDGPSPTSLVEGINIKKCSAIFHKTHSFTEITAIGQTQGSDQMSGTAANEQEADWAGTGYIRSRLIVPAEQPVHGIMELKDRARWEAIWLASDEVRIFITTTGWYRYPGRLWWPLDEVSVYSPMIPMDAVMTIQMVTFKQFRDGGTETEIELRFPWGLNSNTAIGRLAKPPPVAVPQGQEIIPD